MFFRCWCEEWSVTKTLARRLDAFDSWSSDSIYQTCYQWYPQTDHWLTCYQRWRYRQADHRLLSSLPSYSRETAPLLWACGTCWLSAGSPSGYWGVAPTAQSLEGTLWTQNVPPGWWGSTQMYSQLTLGSTQPGEFSQWPYTLATHRRHGNTPSRGAPLKRGGVLVRRWTRKVQLPFQHTSQSQLYR